MAKIGPVKPVKLPKKTDHNSREADRMQNDPHYIQKLQDKRK